MRRSAILSSIRSALIIAYFFGFKPFARNPLWSLNYAISPLAILFFINLYGGQRYLGYALIGGIVSVTVATTIILETDAAFIRLILKLQDMFVASPIGPLTYALGLALGNIAPGLLGLAILGALLGLSVHVSPAAILVIVASVILTWALISMLGFLIASFAKEIKHLWSYSPIITALLSFLPPVFYPATFIEPLALRVASFMAPTAIAATLIRSSIGLEALSPLEATAMWIGLTAYTGVILGLLRKYARWRQE